MHAWLTRGRGKRTLVLVPDQATGEPTMNAIESVMTYATAFEETYIDDDWTRLLPFFSDNAVYEVVGGPFACKIEGKEAILRGLKKSVDGLDRRFDKRSIDVLSGPDTEPLATGDKVTLSWLAHYQLAGAPDISFPGKSTVIVIDGKILRYSAVDKQSSVDFDRREYGGDG